jgi:NADH-quinone oxidoreductase E subunit
MSDFALIFTFTSENMTKIEAHIAKYPSGRQASAVLPVLDLAQRQNGGWLSQSAIETVAQRLGMPVIRVQEVASFYSMFNLKPVGHYHVQVCGTTPCWLMGAEALRDVLTQHLGIAEGDVTADGQFSLAEVECLGACISAPAVQINDDYYENLTPETLVDVLQKLRKSDAR